ncbi:MAG TPA: DUF302 domain-containing protein [Rhizomicrobium sp.]|jgi:uncharacterized protein (DUF302 family)|nr:DUF302 domain-containing protein [Rhizomicrobium sp.]
MTIAGLITTESTLGPRETVERLVAEIARRGLTIFARIDHAAGAAAAGLPLNPTELVIFGNAKGGTPLMQQAQTAGIDLPLKALVWQDGHGRTWLSYNDPLWIAERHEITPERVPNLKMMTGLLADLAAAATAAA